jgi:arylsulfatase A-like enzyme/Flp pilus assembly protein TadD
VLLLALTLLLAANLTGQTQANPPKKSNLLLVTIDTLRADHVGIYGAKEAKTSNIDALGRAGIVFDNAYSVVPITLPSHATILTGTYPMMTGMHDFSGNRLPDGLPTLATELKKQGYDTGAVIAAAVLDHRFGLNAGFDFYYDNFEFSRLDEANLDAMERPANEVVDHAVEWLGKRSSQRPFFLWVHLYDPHHPYAPPAPYDSQFKAAPYDGEIAFVDSQLGRLLQYFKTKGLFDRTVIALAGDHGEGLGEHGEKTHGFFVYHHDLHIPLMIKPVSTGQNKYAGKHVSEPVSLADVMPTVLTLLGEAVPGSVQGRELWTAVAGSSLNKSGIYGETYLARLHFDWSELRSLRRDRYHFIEGPKPELYDVVADPDETRNLYASKQAVAGELRSILSKTISALTPDRDLATKTSLDPSMMERLKALGYIAVSSGSANRTISDPNLPDPKDRIAVYELVSDAISDSQRGRIAESTEKLKKALEQDKGSVPIQYLLALDYYKQNDFEAASQHFANVLRRSPEYALAAYYLGLARGRARDWDGSIQWLSKALALDQTNFSAAMNLGVAYVQKRQFEDADRSFRESIRINPEYAQGHKALGQLLLFKGDVAGAIAALERAAALAPRDPQTCIELSRAYEANGEHEKAAEQRRHAEALRVNR